MANRAGSSASTRGSTNQQRQGRSAAQITAVAVLQDAPFDPLPDEGAMIVGSGKILNVIDEFNRWRKRPDLAEVVAAIMVLMCIIREIEVETERRAAGVQNFQGKKAIQRQAKAFNRIKGRIPADGGLRLCEPIVGGGTVMLGFGLVIGRDGVVICRDG
ncbi:hypothetical protein ACLOJK_002092 [Asimina triloba]